MSFRARRVDKTRNVLATGDASCLTHIGGGLSRLRTGTRSVHLAEILATTETS